MGRPRYVFIWNAVERQDPGAIGKMDHRIPSRMLFSRLRRVRGDLCRFRSAISIETWERLGSVADCFIYVRRRPLVATVGRLAVVSFIFCQKGLLLILIQCSRYARGAITHHRFPISEP
ncbi:unnamed protein product, partial [Hapterophycus canaliculatus]